MCVFLRLPVGYGSAAGDFAEGFIKIGAVVEAAGHSDGGEAGVGAADQLDGALHPLVNDIFHRGKAVEAFEQGGKIGGADVSDGRELRQPDFAVQMILFDFFLNRGRGPLPVPFAGSRIHDEYMLHKYPYLKIR